MELPETSSRIIPLIYVAGPFVGPTNYEIQQNVARAEAIALAIAQAGGLGVCVHTMNRNFFGQKDETFWLAAVMELLKRCDGVVLTNDWERSTGAKREWQLTMELKLPYMVYNDAHGPGAVQMRLERWIATIVAAKAGAPTKPIGAAEIAGAPWPYPHSEHV